MEPEMQEENMDGLEWRIEGAPTPAVNFVPQEFSTRDMSLAACLMVDGVVYLRTERDSANSRRLVFVFENNLDIDRIQQQRANATHVVSSVHYDECLRRLKSIIHGNL